MAATTIAQCLELDAQHPLSMATKNPRLRTTDVATEQHLRVNPSTFGGTSAVCRTLGIPDGAWDHTKEEKAGRTFMRKLTSFIRNFSDIRSAVDVTDLKAE